MICSRRILVCDLPQMAAESLEDKLGYHFSRRANGGGEVDNCWLDPDTGTAVVLFSEEGSEDVVVAPPPRPPPGNACVSVPQLPTRWCSRSSTASGCTTPHTQSEWRRSSADR